MARHFRCPTFLRQGSSASCILADASNILNNGVHQHPSSSVFPVYFRRILFLTARASSPYLRIDKSAARSTRICGERVLHRRMLLKLPRAEASRELHRDYRIIMGTGEVPLSNGPGNNGDVPGRPSRKRKRNSDVRKEQNRVASRTYRESLSCSPETLRYLSLLLS